MMSPTKRSLDYLRDEGWEPGIVERRINRYVTIDLHGFADIDAMKEGEPNMLVQTTTGSNLAARRKKIYANDKALLALRCGRRIVLHGWRFLKTSGKWEPLIEEVTQADIVAYRRAEAVA